MIYLDTAAIVKLVRAEVESPTLIAWLNDRSSEPLVASALVEVELPRALRRNQPEMVGAVALALSRLNRVEINAAVRATAGAYVDPMLRSLDAIHLATAEFLVASEVPVSAFVTYDKRLAVAAGNVGLQVVAPAPTT